MAAAGAESRISAINEINSENILFIRIRRLPFSSFHIHSDLIGNICERARREKLQQKIRKNEKNENRKLRYTCANSKCVSYLNVAFERWLDCRWISVLRQLANANYKIESLKRIMFEYIRTHDPHSAHLSTEAGAGICVPFHRNKRWAELAKTGAHGILNNNEKKTRRKNLSLCLTAQHGNEMAKPIYLMAFLIPLEKYSSFLSSSSSSPSLSLLLLLSFCSECAKRTEPIARDCKSDTKKKLNT